MPGRFRDRLISHISHDTYTPKPIPLVAKELNIDDVKEFGLAVRELAEEGVIDLDETGKIQLPFHPDEGELIGVFRGTASGVGFVQPAKIAHGSDIFIPPQYTNAALSGDTVRVYFSRDQRREHRLGTMERQYAGEVIDIVARKRAQFTGDIEKRDGRWIVYPDGRELTEPIVIRDAESKNVKNGDKVVIEIIEYPEHGRLAKGVVTKVLGEAGEPDVETQAVIAAYSLPSNEFPEACVEQAREATRRFDEEMALFESEGIESLDMRVDLTGDYITTIDPPDAKDYDDAISLKKLENGGWELGIHIADVAHYIEPGSPLDLEAKVRGNSVYLPRLVIPMLPEVLSNGICSLQEGVLRYAKTCIIRYDRMGNVVGRGVCQSLIKSRKRMTYLEAQALIDGDLEEAKEHAKTDTPHTEELIENVQNMNTLSRLIQARRHKAGMIHLDLPEVELVFDDDGKVIDAFKEDDAFTHTLIEMFMVEANEAMAVLFAQLEVPILRRTHPEPTPGDVDDLRKTAMVAGFRIPKSPTREELQALLDTTAGTPASRAVHTAVLRTMTKAVYSPSLIGHYALASHAYAHFTSPIRRYPDLTLHRAMFAFLKRTKNGDARPNTDGEKKALGRELRDDPYCPNRDELSEIGNQCSNTEVNAANAERELRAFLVLQLMEDHIGEEFEACVTGVSPKGIYVQIEKYLADGMIAKKDLIGDTTRSKRPPTWKIDDRTGAMVDIHSGRSYSIGDRLTVCVANVDLQTRRMDLTVADGDRRAAGKRKGPAAKLTLGSDTFGGLGESEGAGFKKAPGGQRRSRKSKSRDKGKTDYRRDAKGKAGPNQKRKGKKK
ncbi:MAG: VacB/RNase II family 3'-5' exoribonuclease [Phycisphaerales bacterium]|nr:VacB/RNase II family 3'-5' exoribonuclease [Phycisphaerales bacterium]